MSMYDTHTVSLLGGARVIDYQPQSTAEVHDLLVRGVPYASLIHLSAHLSHLSDADVANAVGISTRTLRRQKEEPGKRMPPDIGSRVWQLAETLGLAEEVLGDKLAAERWMNEQALGLDGKRPIELLQTSQGAALVMQFLERLKFGVYN